MQAVEVYNKPGSTFRSGTYVMLMVVGWTSLFHAVFFQRGEKPYYRRGHSQRFERIEGDYKWWELSTCLDKFYGGTDHPVRRNLEFFAKLRNKIEHRSMPELDSMIFGECQAMLLNFDDFIGAHFGDKYRLSESLYFSLQFSQAQPARRKIKESAGWADVSSWVQAYRSTLSADVHESNAYSFQVFLLPRIGNHRSSADLAIEWIQYDPSKPEEMAQYEKVAALIKPKQVPVYNLEGYKPSQVSNLVAAGIGKRFSVYYHHSKAWRFYGVRPPAGAPDPASCKGEFCRYDPVHKDYVYTRQWVDFLINELADPAKYDMLTKSSGTTVSRNASRDVVETQA